MLRLQQDLEILVVNKVAASEADKADKADNKVVEAHSNPA
jgi:hypothetical protein